MAKMLDLDSFLKAISTFGGKDKLLRLIQYGCRFNKGLLTETSLITLPAGSEVIKKNWKLFATLMNARRCYRLFAGLPHLITLRDLKKTPWGVELQPLYWCTTFLNVLWPTVDHYRFLMLAGLIKGQQGPVKVVAYRMFALAQIFTFVGKLKVYMGAKDEKDKKNARWGAIKAFLTAITISHVSEFPGLATNELICGGTGVATSLMDLYTAWPTSTPEDSEKRSKGASRAMVLYGATCAMVGVCVSIINSMQPVAK